MWKESNRKYSEITDYVYLMRSSTRQHAVPFHYTRHCRRDGKTLHTVGSRLTFVLSDGGNYFKLKTKRTVIIKKKSFYPVQRYSMKTIDDGAPGAPGRIETKARRTFTVRYSDSTWKQHGNRKSRARRRSQRFLVSTPPPDAYYNYWYDMIFTRVFLDVLPTLANMNAAANAATRTAANSRSDRIAVPRGRRRRVDDRAR